MSQYFKHPDADLAVGDNNISTTGTVAAGATTVGVPGVAATTTPGLIVQNTTPATLGTTVQRSPSSWLYGSAWDVDSAVPRTFGMGWQLRPVSANTVIGSLYLMKDLAGVVSDAGIAIRSDGTIEFGALGTVATVGKLRLANAAGPVFACRNAAGTNNVNFGECLNDIWYLGSSQALGFVLEAGTSGVPATLQLENITRIRLTSSNTAQILRITGRGALSANAAGSAIQLAGGSPNGSGAPGELKLGWGNSTDVFQEGIRIGAVGGALAFNLTGDTPAVKQSITGSRGGNAALADLLTKGALNGFWTDGTSA